MLLPLTFLLLAPVILLTVFDRMRPDKDVSWPVRGRAGLSVFLLATGSAHFVSAAEMAQMLPVAIPGERVQTRSQGLLHHARRVRHGGCGCHQICLPFESKTAAP